jgi:hypothetical protein
LSGVAFEDGGGFRAYYDGHGHHGGKYVKTSSGKNGIHWYLMNEDEFNSERKK